MKAYTAGVTKQQFVNELLKHQQLDNFIRGTYEDNGKGCAVGCSLMSIAKIKNVNINFDQHSLYEKFLGIAEWLARLEDTLFEGISTERSKTWPVEFAQAINTGANLNNIKTDFICYTLQENINTLESIDVDDPIVQQVIDVSRQIIAAQRSGDKHQIESARSATWAARSATESARSAARSAESARSATWAEWSATWAEWSAAWAAESATWAAESATWAARSAVESAEWSGARFITWAARSAARSAEWSGARFITWAARPAVESATFEKYADKLLQLMKQCK
jgi:hypothetical protein